MIIFLQQFTLEWGFLSLFTLQMYLIKILNVIVSLRLICLDVDYFQI